MESTQDYMPIVDVIDDIALLSNGNLAIVIETSAVNFGLLSAEEQYAIIGAFAGLLNSLSFSIQIVIRSKRLDISDYLKLLDKAYQKQTNPLLQNMMLRYRRFIESTVRENEVLDKQFYVAISISPMELGLGYTSRPDIQKAKTLLLPRRDHIMRQLARIGLKSSHLNHKQLVQLFYDLYNFDPTKPVEETMAQKPAATAQTVAPTPVAPRPQMHPLQPQVQTPPVMNPQAQNVQYQGPQPRVATMPMTAQAAPQPMQPQPMRQVSQQPVYNQPNPQMNRPVRGSNPFVVEELHDDYGTGARG